LNAEIEKERESKKQLFLKWLRTKDNNYKLETNGTNKNEKNVTKAQKRTLGQEMFGNTIIFRE
jgi:hypothetical protein